MSSNPFNDKQVEVLKYDNEHEPFITINEGAIRTGKTVINIFLWLKHVAKYKGMGYKFLMLSTSLNTLKENVLDEMEAFFNVDCRLNSHQEFELLGNTMLCRGAAKADSYRLFKGFTGYGAFMNEPTEFHQNSVIQAFERCSGEGARIFGDTNPDAPTHYFKKDYIDKTGSLMNDGSVYIKSWHWTLDDNSEANNGFLSERYIEGIKKSIPSGHFYDRSINGLWVAAEGMIYKDFDESKHVISKDEFEKTYKKRIRDYYLVKDWGWEHKGVLAVYGVDYDGIVYRVEEVAESHRYVNNINGADKKGDNTWIGLAMDWEEKYKTKTIYYDDARPDNASLMGQAGFYMIAADKNVVDGIATVSTYMKLDRLRIVREGNRNYLDEIYSYCWKPEKEEPIKEEDDSMDTERYFIYSKFAKPDSVYFLE